MQMNLKQNLDFLIAMEYLSSHPFSFLPVCGAGYYGNKRDSRFKAWKWFL